MSIAAATLPEYKQFNVDILAGLARKLSNRFSKDKKSAIFSEVAPRAPNRPSPFVNQDDEHHRSSRFSRHVGSEAGSSSSAAPVVNRPLLTTRPQRAKSDKFCSVHRVTTHNTADCRAANAQGDGQSRAVGAAGSVSNVKKCFTCGVSGWTKEHVCNTARPNNDEYTFGAMSMGPARAHNNNYIADAIATTEQAITRGNSSFSGDMDITGDAAYDIARQAQQCKFHPIFSLPPDNKSNMIIIPIIIQSIRTYAIIDTGATFSMISPSFVSFLGTSVQVLPSLGTIQLGHVETLREKVGNISINLFYNNTTLLHKFEIFDFFKSENCKHVPALIGLDLCHKLGIGMTGLALTHLDLKQNNPFPPAPADPISKPNNSPYGTPVERDAMKAILNPLLKENANIDMKNTYGNLPGAIIHLNTKPGCIAFKKQYPLPFAYEDAVRKQIKTWLEEGVIEVATSHTGFNSPLLVVGRKNSDGIFTFDKIRLVTDVRNLNSILTVTDTQSYPLINEIMGRIGAAKIHTIIDIKSCFNSFLVAAEDRHKLSFTCP